TVGRKGEIGQRVGKSGLGGTGGPPIPLGRLPEGTDIQTDDLFKITDLVTSPRQSPHLSPLPETTAPPCHARRTTSDHRATATASFPAGPPRPASVRATRCPTCNSHRTPSSSAPPSAAHSDNASPAPGCKCHRATPGCHSRHPPGTPGSVCVRSPTPSRDKRVRPANSQNPPQC